MAFKHVLKSILDPTIAVKEMSMMNTSSEGEALANRKTWRTNESSMGKKDSAGSSNPFIMINSYILEDKGISDVIIDETGFIPTITVIYNDDSNQFSPVQFPGANPILSIYIKPTNEKMKPIRNDYIITSIRGIDTFIIKGELFIPKLYNNVSKSYKDLNSKDSILEVAREMDLGFQSNECNPSDSMVWINPNWNSSTFMKHVTSHSYQDEDSFFQVFIDKYYHVNFINVNLQIEADGEFDNTIFTGSSDYNLSDDVQSDASKTSVSVAMGLIQSIKTNEGSNVIFDRTLITNQGEILINDGFKKRIYYYDSSLSEEDPIDKLQDFYVKPTVSTNIINRDKSLVPENIQLKDNEIKKWINIQYENVHTQYTAAKIINHHNLLELDKIKLVAHTKGINFNASRGMRVPVGIYESSADAKTSRAWDSLEEKEKLLSKTGTGLESDTYEIYNEFLSGIYYTMGSRYIYEKGEGYRTEIILGRRDWVPNPVT